MPFAPYFTGDPFRPGQNERPDESSPALIDLLDNIIKPVKSKNWQDNRVYLTGWGLFEAGYYWEAHHLWEAVWMGAQEKSPEKYLLEGLIQLTNTVLKIRLGRKKAALRLISLTESKIGEAFLNPSTMLMGVRKNEILERIAHLKQEMMRDFDPEIGISVPKQIKVQYNSLKS